jgi:hypothetical protein
LPRWLWGLRQSFEWIHEEQLFWILNPRGNSREVKSCGSSQQPVNVAGISIKHTLSFSHMRNSLVFLISERNPRWPLRTF